MAHASSSILSESVSLQPFTEERTNRSDILTSTPPRRPFQKTIFTRPKPYGIIDSDSSSEQLVKQIGHRRMDERTSRYNMNATKKDMYEIERSSEIDLDDIEDD